MPVLVPCTGTEHFVYVVRKRYGNFLLTATVVFLFQNLSSFDQELMKVSMRVAVGPITAQKVGNNFFEHAKRKLNMCGSATVVVELERIVLYGLQGF